MRSRVLTFGFLLIIAVATFGVAYAQSELERNFQAKWEEWHRLYADGKIKDAVAVLEELRTTEGIQDMERAWMGVLYNLACGYSLMGEKGKAIAFLEDAIDAGYNDYEHFQKDRDFDNIRDTEEFEQLCHRAQLQNQFWDNRFLGTEYQEDISVDEKVAGLSKLWSEVKYNFVYFDRMPDLNWDSLYVSYLPKVSQTGSTLEYYRTLQEMCAHLNDGHTSIIPPPKLYDELWARPPIRTDLVEGRVLILDVDSDSLLQLGIKPGLEITHINDMPVKLYVRDSALPFLTVSTEQARTWKAYNLSLLSGSVNNPVSLTFVDKEGNVFSETVSRRSWHQLHNNRPEVSFEMLEGNIAYVELTTFGSDDIVTVFDSLFVQIEQAEALIIDVRRNGGGNSGVGWQILGYLTDSMFACLQCKMRTYHPQRRLDGLGDKWDVSNWKHPAKESRRFAGPVVILIGPATGSAAEDFLVPFDFMNRGKLIGEPTAGSTGQPLLFSLPGGGRGKVCTKRCTYPDGKEFVGVGVQPDILVHPGVEDFRSGRDAVLEAAIVYLKETLGE